MEALIEHLTKKIDAHEAISLALQHEVDTLFEERTRICVSSVSLNNKYSLERALSALVVNEEAMKSTLHQMFTKQRESIEVHIKMLEAQQRMEDFAGMTAVEVEIVVGGRVTHTDIDPNQTAAVLETMYPSNAIEINGIQLTSDIKDKPLYALFTPSSPQRIIVRPLRTRGTLSIPVIVIGDFRGHVFVEGREPMSTLVTQVANAVGTPLKNMVLFQGKLVSLDDATTIESYVRTHNEPLTFLSAQ
jgi:hypothetical protein